IDEQLAGTDFYGWFDGGGSGSHSDSSKGAAKLPTGTCSEKFVFAQSRQDGATLFFGRRIGDTELSSRAPRFAQTRKAYSRERGEARKGGTAWRRSRVKLDARSRPFS